MMQNASFSWHKERKAADRQDQTKILTLYTNTPYWPAQEGQSPEKGTKEKNNPRRDDRSTTLWLGQSMGIESALESAALSDLPLILHFLNVSIFFIFKSASKDLLYITKNAAQYSVMT